MSLEKLVEKTKSAGKRFLTAAKAYNDSLQLFLTSDYDNNKEFVMGGVLAAMHYKARTDDNPFYKEFIAAFRETAPTHMGSLAQQYLDRIE